uniref:WGS project CBMI000000000 data, contig n=1 Tax=Panagrellus redivivus TaxID=6233 RepID=A0A7E4ZTA7_PANRE
MYPHTVKRLEQCLYTTTTPDSETHQLVVVFHEQCAVTHYHGPHASFKQGDEITIYSVLDKAVQFQVTVIMIDEDHDYMLLEKHGDEFPAYPWSFESLGPGDGYYLFDITQTRSPTMKEGVVTKFCGNFLLGKHGQRSNGVAGMFKDNGWFIGISVNTPDSLKGIRGEEADPTEAKLVGAPVLISDASCYIDFD